MRLDTAAARARFAGERVARLATVGADLAPHLVPIVFALSPADQLYFAVDAKPKSTLALKRLANIATNPRVAVLADRYDDDWTQLWWARADGTARIVEGGTAAAGVELLAERYPVYRHSPPPGPVVEISIERWAGWSAAAQD